MVKKKNSVLGERGSNRRVERSLQWAQNLESSWVRLLFGVREISTLDAGWRRRLADARCVYVVKSYFREMWRRLLRLSHFSSDSFRVRVYSMIAG